MQSPLPRRALLLESFKLFDLVTLALSFGIAAFVAKQQFGAVSLAHFLSLQITLKNLAAFLGLLVLWRGVFSFQGLYYSKRLSSRLNEVFGVIKATFIGTLCIVVAAFLFRIEIITPFFAGVFWAASSAITVLSRLGLRYVLGQARVRGRNMRQMLIVGTGPRAIAFARKIEKRLELGYDIIGFVDDNWEGTEEFRSTNYRLLGDINSFPELLKNTVIDEVVICLPMNSRYQDASRVVLLCEEQGILIRIVTDIFNLNLAKPRAELVEDDYVITLCTGGMNGLPVLVKQFFDVVLSSVLLVAMSPVFILISVLIKLDSPGPVFFVQRRMGLNKRPFNMVKFRSMKDGAEGMFDRVSHLNEESGPAFKIRNDPRITRLGALLRRLSLDELPQLVNVLKGEMSLVGPRPFFSWEYERITEPWIQRRCSVRPGLTGLWQINGRSSVSFDSRIRLDLEYIDNWSLGMDLKILAKTILIVALGKGAV